MDGCCHSILTSRKGWVGTGEWLERLDREEWGHSHNMCWVSLLLHQALFFL